MAEEVGRALTSPDAPRYDGDSETFVIQDVRGHTTDSAQNGPRWSGEGVSYTLGAVERHGVAHPITASYAKQADSSDTNQGSPNLIVEAGQCHGGDVGKMASLRAGRGDVQSGVPFIAHTLKAEGADASEDGTGRRVPRDCGDLSVALSTGGGKPGKGYPAVAFTERTRRKGRTLETSEDQAYALTNPGAGGRSHSRQVMDAAMVVRRLTPTECERLQGFPDGWTAEGPDGKPIADSPRYRMLGNAVVPAVAEWIGRRLVEADEKR